MIRLRQLVVLMLVLVSRRVVAVWELLWKQVERVQWGNCGGSSSSASGRLRWRAVEHGGAVSS